MSTDSNYSKHAILFIDDEEQSQKYFSQIFGRIFKIYLASDAEEGLKLFENRMRCLPEAADGFKAAGQDGLAWLDEQMQDNQFICGDRITIADLVLYCCTDFAAGVGQSIDINLKNVTAWFSRMESRPSSAESLHPASEKVGMKG